MSTAAPTHHKDDSDDARVTDLTSQLEQDCRVNENDVLQHFSRQLVEMCNTIFTTLGSQQSEATYQTCLKMELEQAGWNVQEEVEIPLMYKNSIVGTRRADLVVPSIKVVLELKAVHKLTPSHAKQLQYYMQHLNMDYGYLINFPHDDGFPDVTTTSVFRLSNVNGLDDGSTISTLDTPLLRLRHANDQVQIVHFQRLQLDSPEGIEALKEREKKRAAQPLPKWGVTTTGLPCKICEEDQAYCRYHKDQAPKTERLPLLNGCTVS